MNKKKIGLRKGIVLKIDLGREIGIGFENKSWKRRYIYGYKHRKVFQRKVGSSTRDYRETKANAGSPASRLAHDTSTTNYQEVSHVH